MIVLLRAGVPPPCPEGHETLQSRTPALSLSNTGPFNFQDLSRKICKLEGKCNELTSRRNAAVEILADIKLFGIWTDAAR